MLRWTEVKDHFVADGSWRDIVVAGTNNADWTTMLRWLRESEFPVEFTFDGEPESYPDVVNQALWDRQQFEGSQQLTVGVPGTPKCHFFGAEELELDIDPGQVHDELSLASLFAFIRGLGRALGKQVTITPENVHECPLIKYDPVLDQVRQGGFTMRDA